MKCDVLIVGGGVVGCAAAYHLAKGGSSVIVAERGELNRQASGRNAGSLHFQMEHRLIRHGDSQAELFSQAIPLALLAIENWSRIEEELGCDLEVRLKGGIMVAETQDALQMLRLKHSLERKWNLPTELLTRKEALEIAPYLSLNIIAAGYCASEGQANPRLVAPAFARRAVEFGAIFMTGTTVRRFRRNSRSWTAIACPTGTVETGGRSEAFDIEASAVLDAAGAWSAHVAESANVHLPLIGVPITMNVTERAEPFIDHLVQNAGRQLSMKQASDGNVLIGGGWSARFHQRDNQWDVDAPPRVLPQHVIGNLDAAVRTVPEVRQLQLIRCWTGSVAITADQLPILGEVRAAPGFYVAVGGTGFTLGPTFAQLISELIQTGTTSRRIDVYSPNRFHHINMFMG
jgi:glycine/D-amino acid oxidase-like deaminating enzyme